MTRYRWRIRAVTALLVSLVMATGMLAQTVSVSAAGQGQMEWTGSRWEDPVCDTANELYDVRAFRDANYGGTQWRFCGSKPNLCWSPYGNDSLSSQLCVNGGYDGDTANDFISSYKVISINGGSSCRIQLKEHAQYGGGGLVEWDPVERTSAFPYNDAISSVRRVC